MIRFFILLACLALPLKSLTQYVIKGQVLDKSTREALAFVNIVSSDGKYGASTDIEGRFVLKSDRKIDVIKLSYIGYITREYLVDYSKNNQVVYMDKSEIELDIVDVFPGINPADLIMQKAIDNRSMNNPEKSVNFSYVSYNKLFVTLDLDSSLVLHPEKISKLDSSDQEAIRFFEKQHLFMAESVTERKFMRPDKNSETVLASKVSGFENPIFNLLATELQSFTFYKDFVNLGGIQYEGPLAKGATKRYFFLIEDTLYDGADSIFIISYRPMKGKDFKGMKGTLSIHTSGYAIQNVIAEPAKEADGSMRMKIRQQYEKKEGQWFPVQLSTTIYFDMVKINNMTAVGIAHGYLKDIKINPEMEKKEFNAVDLKMDENAAKQGENYWDQFRRDSLTAKERETYRVIDSISKAENLEKKMNRLSYILDGQWPIGPVSLDLDKLINFNDYEGLRLGIGLHTNDKISKYVNVGGYFAYGFQDKAIKYGGDLNFILPKKDAGLTFAYKHDLAESGGVSYFGRRSFISEDLSDLFRNRFDKTDKYEVSTWFRALKHYKIFVFGNTQLRTSFEDYLYLQPVQEGVNREVDQYFLTEAGAAVRFQFREKFIETPKKLISKGSGFPVLWVKYTRGIKDLLYGEFEYDRIDTRLEKKHRIRRIGHLFYRADAGIIHGDVPYGILYNPRGTYRTMKQFPVYSGGGFETMRTNEFFADRYAALLLRFDFKSFIHSGKIRPDFAVSGNFFIGDLSHPENHRNVLFTVPDKGFFETGLHINNIFRSGISGIGLGAFYRLGAYQFEEFSDNIALKMTLTFNLN